MENFKTSTEKRSVPIPSLVTDNSDLAENARLCPAKNAFGRLFSSG
jgi:hypothetical protein